MIYLRIVRIVRQKFLGCDVVYSYLLHDAVKLCKKRRGRNVASN